MIHSTATASDGTTLAYSLSENASTRKRVVLVHPLALDGSAWSAIVERLAPHASVLTVDVRGHGASGKPAGPYTVAGCASDVAAVLDHLGWRSAVVAGASMGGCISLAFAKDFPDRVAGLGLIDTTAWYGADAPTLWEERAQNGRTKGLASLVPFQKSRWFSEAFISAHPALLDALVAIFVRNDLDAYVESCRMLGVCDVRDALPTFRMPTAIVVGSEDYATPVAMAEVLHAQIAGSSYTVLDGARHLTILERADDVAAAILSLFAARVA